jgi:hypothetical protein
MTKKTKAAMGGFLTSVLRNRVSAMGVALTTASALLFIGLVVHQRSPPAGLGPWW